MFDFATAVGSRLASDIVLAKLVGEPVATHDAAGAGKRCSGSLSLYCETISGGIVLGTGLTTVIDSALAGSESTCLT